MKKTIATWISICCFAFCFFTSAKAMSQDEIPYETYTYGYDGNPLKSPHAYEPESIMTGMDMGCGDLREPLDLKIDNTGNVYIADTGNNRIVVLNPDLSLSRVLADFDNGGDTDTFNKPGGICVTSDKLYVSDTDNKRILIFDLSFKLQQVISEPSQDVLPDKYNFAPAYLSVDKSGRIYLISRETVYGIMAFNSNGEFETFVGAMKTKMKPSDIFWRSFMTKDQKKNLSKIIPTNYNNLTTDEEGFIYATSVYQDQNAVIASMITREAANFALVRKLNSAGDDVLKRLGFFPPAGDISSMFSGLTITPQNNATGPSQIVGVAVGENGIYSLIDAKRNKIFTYDSDSNLLYAFGGTGYQKGKFQTITSIAYYGSDIVILDGGMGAVTKFSQTDYGKLISDTIKLSNNREYDKAVANYKELLKENSGLSIANVGMGKAKMREGSYQEAMEYFKKAHDIENYSKAFALERNLKMEGFVMLVPIIAVLVIFGLYKFLGYVKKYNKCPTTEKGTVMAPLLYSFYVIFHPFDGVWDIKHEKRGSKRGAAIIFGAVLLSVAVNKLITGYIFNPDGKNGVLNSILAALLLMVLFCVSNWCFTTLMNGKGRFKDILITVCYCLTPIVFVMIPAGIFTNILVISESGVITMLTAAGFIWAGILLFLGIMVTHQYSLPKNVLSFILTIIGMMAILFVGLLIINLFGRIGTFIGNLLTELSLRM